MTEATQYVTLVVDLVGCDRCLARLGKQPFAVFHKKGWVKTIYTPLLSVPLAIVNEYAAQYVVILIADGSWDFSGATFAHVIRQMAVLLCLICCTAIMWPRPILSRPNLIAEPALSAER